MTTLSDALTAVEIATGQRSPVVADVMLGHVDAAHVGALMGRLLDSDIAAAWRDARRVHLAAEAGEHVAITALALARSVLLGCLTTEAAAGRPPHAITREHFLGMVEIAASSAVKATRP